MTRKCQKRNPTLPHKKSSSRVQGPTQDLTSKLDSVEGNLLTREKEMLGQRGRSQGRVMYRNHRNCFLKGVLAVFGEVEAQEQRTKMRVFSAPDM